MNKKGFTLIEMLGCLALLGFVLTIGLLTTREHLSTSLSILNNVSVNQIKKASELYVLENVVTWSNIDGEEYTCITIDDLVDYGYFKEKEVTSYKDDHIKIVRLPKNKVIEDIQITEECE